VTPAQYLVLHALAERTAAAFERIADATTRLADQHAAAAAMVQTELRTRRRPPRASAEINGDEVRG
jgi:hypothetical protein